MLHEIGIVQWVYHFQDHSKPNEPFFICNPEETPFDPESRELFITENHPYYKVVILCFNLDCQSHSKGIKTPRRKLTFFLCSLMM